MRLPGRTVLRDLCAWRYRTWDGSAWDYSAAECPYTGTAYFDGSDTAVNEAEDDVCSRRLSGCRARFGSGSVSLPFGGFAGVLRSA